MSRVVYTACLVEYILVMPRVVYTTNLVEPTRLVCVVYTACLVEPTRRVSWSLHCVSPGSYIACLVEFILGVPRGSHIHSLVDERDVRNFDTPTSDNADVICALC